jgi:2-C-methyl-D-erythritol 4-phosphate cytidylyltransferase
MNLKMGRFENEGMQKKYVIIVAGGSGQRMKSIIPKQFMELAGKPILMHTINKFYTYDADMTMILVLPADHIPLWKDLCERFQFSIPHQITPGGETRFHSVKNGLALTGEEGVVAIHDGVRPLISHATIDRCFLAASQWGNAIPCIPVHESVREEGKEGNKIINRSNLKLIQTPQVFKIHLIKKAFEQPFDPCFTDDASVLERLGEKIHLVEGNRENIKVTEPVDLIFAESMMGRE